MSDPHHGGGEQSPYTKMGVAFVGIIIFIVLVYSGALSAFGRELAGLFEAPMQTVERHWGKFMALLVIVGLIAISRSDKKGGGGGH